MIRQNNFTETTTFKIIVLNVVVYLLFIILTLFLDFSELISLLALQPSLIIKGEKLWTIITSMFLHTQVWHLIANMISLYFVGNFVERLIGKKRFLFFYLGAGIFAGIFWTLVSNFLSVTPLLTRVFGNPLIPGIGASGAVFGLVGILAVLTPKARVSFIAGPLVAFILIGVLSSSQQISTEVLGILNILFFAYIILTTFAMLSFNSNLIKYALPVNTTMSGLAILAIIPLIIISIFVSLPIGNMAHLGGLIFGVIYASHLRKRFPRKSKMISNMFK